MPDTPLSAAYRDHAELEALLAANDDDHMVASGEHLSWLIEQIIRWPARVHPDRTTNDRFLRMSAVATLLALLAENARLREAMADAEAVIDYAASVLWTSRPAGVQSRPAKIDKALRSFRALRQALTPKGPSDGE